MKKLVLVLACSVLLLALSGVTATAASGSGVQSLIGYYNANDGSSFLRSTAPFSSGVATQVANADGSVTLNITGGTGYADSGFTFAAGKLGDLNQILINGTGDTYNLNLWFDVDKDGQFFVWNSSGLLTGLGGDTYGLGPGSTSGALVVDGSSTFFMMSGCGSPTLAQLKAGACAGIDATTPIAAWVGVSGSGTRSATINSVAVVAFAQCSVDINPGTKTVTLLSDCTTDHTLLVPDGWTFDGGGHILTAVDPAGGHFLGAVVKNAGTSANVKNLTVTTSGLSNVCDGGDDRLRGILFDDAGGSILNNTVTHLNQGASGCQEGNGIEVRNFSSSVQRFVTIDGNSVVDYQKNGITANGTVAAVITNNVVTGAGAIDYIAQNGIQVAYGATAKITGNSSSGNNYTPASWVACGLLYYDAGGVKASQNTLFANERDLCNFGKGGGQFQFAP